MKYTITYQERPGVADRPIEDGRDLTIDVNDENGFALIPNVGDYVQMAVLDDTFPHFEGRVESRLFRYYLGHNMATACHVNIVVDSSVDWPDLIKE